MGTKLTLTNITSGYNGVTIDSNFDTVADEFDKVVYRDGTAPSSMSASLDMNSNKIVNLAAPTKNQDAARLKDITDAASIESTTATLTSISDSGSHFSSDNVEGALQELGSLTGITSSVAEINVLDGLTSTTAELNTIVVPQSERVELGGDFTAGEEVVCERVSNTVTITAEGSNNTAHSAGYLRYVYFGVIPSAYRPDRPITNVYFADGSTVSIIEVAANGTVTTTYFDWSGTGVSRTLAGKPNVTYVIESEIT